MPKFNPSSSLITKLFFSFWFVYFLLFWSRAVWIDEAGNFIAGHVNIWGDWAAHFTMATAMAERDFLLTQSPFLWGAKFGYPFVSDLLSGILYRLSGDLIYSFLVPSFLLSLFFVWAVYYFFKTLWQSSKKAVLSSLIFLLNGGLGFYYYFRDNLAHSSFLELLIKPLHEVTRFDQYQIKWISIIDSMIIPQRAFLLGFPLTLLALTFIYQYFFNSQNKKPWRLISAGLILGTMPIIHTHSFLAAFIILAFWCGEDLLNHLSTRRSETNSLFGKRLIAWIGLALATGLISLPLLVIYFFGQVDHGFAKFFPGWLATSFNLNWFEFWWRNWLLTPWLAILGFFLVAKKELRGILIFSPFVFIFIIANLFLFQPFAWDNTKLIVWASLGFSYLVVYVLQKTWEKSFRWRLVNALKLPILAGILGLTILSGSLDLHYVLRHDLHHYIMYSREELELAAWIKANTPASALWLTGDKHNHPVFNLTGRQTVMTYRGWLWTHGYKYLPIEKDVSDFYQNPQAHQDFLTKYPVKYIVIGDNERSVWKANDQAFGELFPLIRETRTYKIFENQYN